MDENIKVFIVYIALLISKITTYLASKAQIALFIAKKVTIPGKYTDFAHVFFYKLAKVLAKQTGINKHAIKLVDSQQLSNRPIYNLGLIELKIFKT